MKELGGHTSAVVALVALPNGRLASGSDLEDIIEASGSDVMVWDIATGTWVKKLHGGAGGVEALAALGRSEGSARAPLAPCLPRRPICEMGELVWRRQTNQ